MHALVVSIAGWALALLGSDEFLPSSWNHLLQVRVPSVLVLNLICMVLFVKYLAIKFFW